MSTSWQIDAKSFGVKDFLIDFFGSLMPGFVFVMIFLNSIFSLVLTIYSCCLPLRSLHLDFYTFLSLMNKGLQVEFVFFIFIISYIAGHLFFRRDPKVVDKKSCMRNYRELAGDDPAVEFYAKGQKANIPIIGKNRAEIVKKASVLRQKKKLVVEADYPYSHLKRYLTARKLTHLADLINWGDEQENQNEVEKHARTKAYINILKVRIEFFFPEKSGNIIRNEAHIRLMSSVWYLCDFFKWFDLALLSLGAFFFMLFRYGSTNINQIPFIVAGEFLLLVVVLIAKVIQIVIEKFFHYQRIREIIYVLETAYTANILENRFFDGLQSSKLPGIAQKEAAAASEGNPNRCVLDEFVQYKEDKPVI